MSANFLTILAYNSGIVLQIDMEEVDGYDYHWSTEQFESFILENLKLNLDEIEWMTHADPDIRKNKDIYELQA